MYTWEVYSIGSCVLCLQCTAVEATFLNSIYRTQWTRKLLFLARSVCFLFVYEISLEPLNGFAPNSHGRRVWSVARTSLKVKVKGQGHQGQKWHFSTLSAACMPLMFGKTSLASSFYFLLTQLLQSVQKHSPRDAYLCLLNPPYDVGPRPGHSAPTKWEYKLQTTHTHTHIHTAYTVRCGPRWAADPRISRLLGL